MKKLQFLALAFMLTVTVAQAQYQVPENEVEQQQVTDHSFYFGLGTGINSNCGIVGLLAEVPVYKGLSINGGLGLGMWGIKSAIGFKYHPQFPYKVYYGISFTSAGGISGLPIELQTEASEDETEEVEMNLLRANNIALAIGYDFKVLSFMRINLELGYSIALDSKPYKVVDPAQELTNESEMVMDVMSPGGLILGLGLTFGIN